MQKYWTRFWHRRYGNCYTFNKGIDANGTRVDVMNTSQPGFGNLCFLFERCCLKFKGLERLSMTFTADGKRQRLPLIFYSFLVILK